MAQMDRRAATTISRLEAMEGHLSVLGERLSALEVRMTEREELNGALTDRLGKVADLAEGTRNAMGRLETRTGEMQRELAELRRLGILAAAQREAMVAAQRSTLDALNGGFAGLLGKLNQGA